MRLSTRIVTAAGAFVFLASCGRPPSPATNAAAPNISVHAIRYGTIRFPVSALVQGADTARRLDIAMTVWLIRRPDGHVVLMDAGFYRDKFVQRWKPRDYLRPSEAVRSAGVKPEDVTDIIISHVHWDHM